MISDYWVTKLILMFCVGVFGVFIFQTLRKWKLANLPKLIIYIYYFICCIFLLFISDVSWIYFLILGTILVPLILFPITVVIEKYYKEQKNN